MQPLPDPVDPTAENVARLKTNLKNMQTFNDQLYTYTIPKCANAFYLLAKTDNSDPGMNVGINLLCGALIGIGGEFGIIGCVAANYFCGLIAEYTTTKPPSLLEQFTSYISRVQATSSQVDMDIAISDSDPVSNWNTVKTGSFATPWGTQSASCSLGQLAAIDFPKETDVLYQQMMDKALFSFDQTTWWIVINANFQSNGWNSGWLLPPIIQASDVPKGDEGMNNYSNNYMVEFPPHWSYWIYCAQTDKKGRDTSYYVLYDYSLGSPPHKGNDQPISNEAANYLFIDTIPGTVVNAAGLFNRLFVFTKFGLKVIEQVS
jgi:hypothetical protein